MTQTGTFLAAASPNHPAPAPTTVLADLAAWDLLITARLDALTIPTTGGEPSVISGGPTARYGALIRFETERFPTDTRGATWAKRLVSYVEPCLADKVLTRMLVEGRSVYAVTAVRAALGGTTTA